MKERRHVNVPRPPGAPFQLTPATNQNARVQKPTNLRKYAAYEIERYPHNEANHKYWPLLGATRRQQQEVCYQYTDSSSQQPAASSQRLLATQKPKIPQTADSSS